MQEPVIDLTIVDHFDPETLAMLQAYYSRSHKRIKERLAELGTDPIKVKESLKQYYIGYGHESIGQCGNTAIFIEGVSILAAKMYQDSPLYNGQETSTRFIDFSTQAMHSPIKDAAASLIQKKWIDFYTNSQQAVMKHVVKELDLNLTDSVQAKAAKARTFDILRAFVPAGACTQLSWYTSFSHSTDRLKQLCFHPLEEIREVSFAIANFLEKKYPYACADLVQRININSDYYTANSKGLNYLVASESELNLWPEFDFKPLDVSTFRTTEGLNRVKGVPVARHLAYQGRMQFKYILDYGSFRDIQRHRNCVQMQPILTTNFGFHDWYIESLPEELRSEAELLIEYQTKAINALYDFYDETIIQYYIPLGFKVPCLIDLDYPQAVYMSELRAGKTVHPTLQVVAKRIASNVDDYGFVQMFYNKSDDDFTVRRGQQDIVKIG